ncbi:MAG: hypothetical protein AAGD07_19260 [Planctomycetota bacterium]
MPKSTAQRLTTLPTVLLLAIAFGDLPIRGEAPDTPQHIVLIMTDDQGYGDLGYHGSAVLQTPHLDGPFGFIVGKAGDGGFF